MKKVAEAFDAFKKCNRFVPQQRDDCNSGWLQLHHKCLLSILCTVIYVALSLADATVFVARTRRQEWIGIHAHPLMGLSVGFGAISGRAVT